MRKIASKVAAVALSVMMLGMGAPLVYADDVATSSRLGSETVPEDSEQAALESVSEASVETTGEALPEGTYVIRTALANTKVLDVAAGSTNSGANVQIYSCNMSNAQKFAVTYDEEGYATITNVNSGMVLDVSGGRAVNGRNVQQYASNGTDAQKWHITSTDGKKYTITSKLNDKYVLDVAGASSSNGANVQVYSSNSTAAQSFYFIGLDAEVTGDDIGESGTFTIKSALDTSKVIDIAGASTANGAACQLYSSNGTIAQKFVFTRNSDGSYSIRAISSGKALDVDSGGVCPTTKVQQWAYTETNANQKWFIQKNGDGTVTFLAATSGMALDVDGAKTSNGTRVQLYTSNGTNAQKWILTDVTNDVLNDGYYNITPVCSSRMLDIDGGSREAGANVQIWDNNGTQAQKFKVTKTSSGTYTLQSLNSGLYLCDTSDNACMQAKGTSGTEWNISYSFGGLVLTNAATGKVLDVKGAGDYDGCNVDTYAANGTNAQKFNFTGTAMISTSYNFSIVTSGGAIDVNGASNDDGANIQLYAANDSGAQKWIFSDAGNGYYTITNGKSGKVLDVKDDSASSGANIQQWSANGCKAQHFRLIFTDDGWFYIQSERGLYLTANSTDSGANVYGTTDVSKAQKFRFNLTDAYNPYAEGAQIAYEVIKNMSSSTNYLLAINLDYYTTYCFQGSAGNWKLIRSMPCGVGRDGPGGDDYGPTFRGTYYLATWAYGWDYAREGLPGPRCYEPSGWGVNYFSSIWASQGFHSTVGCTDDWSQVGCKISHGCVRLFPADAIFVYNLPEETTIYSWGTIYD